MSSDVDPGLLGAVFGFAGGLLSQTIWKVTERFLGKRLDEGEMSRDLVIQMASALDGLEGHLKPLLQPFPPDDDPLTRERLSVFPSGFDLAPPAFTLDKLLASFANPEVHRLLILFYNRLDLYAKRSAEHRGAYYWLLDSPKDCVWNEPAAKERIETIQACRDNMFTYAQDLLQFGWGLVYRLFSNTDSFSATAARGDAAPYRGFLEAQYGLTSDAVRLKRAYYAGRPSSRFLAKDKEVLVTWDDEIGRRLGGKKAWLSAIVNDETRARCIPAFEEVTLPSNATLRQVHVRAVGGSDWTLVDNKIEMRFDRIGPSTLRLPDDALRKIATE